jgi:hypothetical protein
MMMSGPGHRMGGYGEPLAQLGEGLRPPDADHRAQEGDSDEAVATHVRRAGPCSKPPASADADAARRQLEKAERTCLITQSLKVTPELHARVTQG